MLVILGYAEDYGNRDRVSIKYGLGLIKEAKTFSGEVTDRQKVGFVSQPILPFEFKDKWQTTVKQPVPPKNGIHTEYAANIPYPDGWVGFNAIYVIRDKNYGFYIQDKWSSYAKSEEPGDYYPLESEFYQRTPLGVAGADSTPLNTPEYEMKTSFTANAFQDRFISPVVTYRVLPIIAQYKSEPEYYRKVHYYLGIAKSLAASSYEPRKSYSYEIKCEIGKKAVIYSIPEGTDAEIVNLIGLPFDCITKDGKQVVVSVNFSTPLLAIIKTSDDVEIKVRIVPYYSWRREVLDRVR